MDMIFFQKSKDLIGEIFLTVCGFTKAWQSSLSSCLLAARNTAQEPPWRPETEDSTKPSTYTMFVLHAPAYDEV